MQAWPTAFFYFLFLAASAQKREEIFDFSFKPANGGPFYYVVTQKTDSGWHREAWYISQKTTAMKGLYKDEDGTIENGLFTWYHPTGFLLSQGRYAAGKQDGLWVGYDDKGVQTDSSNYSAGHRTGVSLHWHNNGFQRDSFNFDGRGNGVEVAWYDDGTLASAGRRTGDTLKQGRWKYYQKNGSVLATEDYAAGKKIDCACYDDSGKALDTALCAEKEARPAGGLRGWQNFLERGLLSLLDAKAASREWPAGQRTVAIRFVVEKDGSLSEFTPLTQYGRGVEEAIITLLKRSPRWTPGRQFGRPVKSYHTQPIMFEVQER